MSGEKERMTLITRDHLSTLKETHPPIKQQSCHGIHIHPVQRWLRVNKTKLQPSIYKEFRQSPADTGHDALFPDSVFLNIVKLCKLGAECGKPVPIKHKHWSNLSKMKHSLFVLSSVYSF